jgi:hypothetical protein
MDWLLEDDNPGVRLRALRGLCDLPKEDEAVRAARQRVVEEFPLARDLTWMEKKGIVLIHNLTALAESGLSKEDLALGPVVDRLLDQPFDANCGDMMLLRALVMLGYAADERVKKRLRLMTEAQLPDGGWLCMHRLRKLKRVPKSCIKANMHALLLAGELSKCGILPDWRDALIGYFRKRNLFYRGDDPNRLVLDCTPGYRMIDVFFPIEFMRVGLPHLMEALAAAGAGTAPEFQEAWQRLESKYDSRGRLKLEGTMPKSYLEKERVGSPTKWGTLYAALAWKQR